MSKTSNSSFKTALSVKTGFTWWRFRRHLLNGAAGSGSIQVENLNEGIFRYSGILSRSDLLELIGLGQASLPEVVLKDDLKRSTSRVWLNERSYILKKFRRLHRWSMVSPDQKGWLGAHHLNNDVACYAWYRRNDLSYAIIVYEDAGDLDLYMPQCLQSPPELLNELFFQAGVMLAKLHQQNTFHADTKPGNFVYLGKQPNPQLKLIDTDDVRTYWRISKHRRIRNLAQFIGCTRPEFSQLYPSAWEAFFQGYLQHSGTSPKELLAMFPALQKSVDSLYPERKSLNHQLLPQFEAQLAAYTRKSES